MKIASLFFVFMISSADIKLIVSSAISMGMALYAKIHQPEDDRIGMREAIRYMKCIGIDNSRQLLEKWIADGKLKAMKGGDAPNSKMKISFVELQREILEMNINTLVNYKI